MSSEDEDQSEGDPYIVVEGSDVPLLNGEYEMDGSNDGVDMYSWNPKDNVTFYLYRSQRKIGRFWLITNGFGKGKETIHYCRSATGEENEIPKSGLWPSRGGMRGPTVKIEYYTSSGDDDDDNDDDDDDDEVNVDEKDGGDEKDDDNEDEDVASHGDTISGSLFDGK